MLSIPDGYTLLRPEPGLALLLRQGLLPLLEQAGLTRFPIPPPSAAHGPEPAAGRGPAWRVELGDGPPLVIKHYRRGGLLGKLRGDRYTGVNRQFEEIRVCQAARAAGLRVPLIQCLWVERAGRFSSRMAAATREIPGARDLFHTLGELREAPERGLLLAAVATEVRKLHDAGILHPDLNLGNILVAGSVNEAEIHLIDFDRASVMDRPLDRKERQSALTRMYRSLAKLSRPAPPPLSPEEKELFLSSYWHDETGPHTALRRRCRRELALHRFWWRLNPPRGGTNR
jgi:tRNA A-37 threonylcarbamoyl transferase component Bud32